MNINKSALILVTHNNYEIMLEAISSIYLHTDPDLYTLFIIDNASNDDTLKLYKQYLMNTKIIRSDENIYWVGGINKGLELTQNYRYIFFLNDDIEVYDNWLKNHIDVLDKYPDVGAIGPLNSSPRDWQYYDKVREKFKLHDTLPYTDKLDNIAHVNKLIYNTNPSFTYIHGMLAFFCVAFRRETIDKVGYLDERFIMGGDDDAYCRELEKHNYKLGLLLNTYIKHKAGTSINKMDIEYKKKITQDNIKLLKELYPNYYG